jgi:hypothetical protein
MKIQVGCGDQRLDGFLNVDIRPLPTVDIVAHAGKLDRIADRSVEAIFSSAFFEHLFAAQHMPTLLEWKRVLRPEGVVVMLGIPDFAAIARYYLDGAPGVVGDRFDLYNVFRYTHGMPEIGTANVWSSWDPGRMPDTAPPGWLPQLHKAIFDADYVYALTDACGLAATVVRYAFPGESHVLNLGFVARVGTPGAAPQDAEALAVLRGIPAIERFMTLETVTFVARRHAAPLMLRYVGQAVVAPG